MRTRLLGLSLRGLSEQDAAIWIDMVRCGWLNHPKALPMQIVGLSLMAWLIGQSSLSVMQWLPFYACMTAVVAGVVPLALRFRKIELHAGNYRPWRLTLIGWRAVHAVAGGVLCATLYGGLSAAWQLPLLVTIVVFTYGMTFYAIEDFGLAMVGTAPIVLCLLWALVSSGNMADRYIAVLLVAASINGWLAGRAISIRLFEAARTRQRNDVLVGELAKEVEAVTRAKAQADEANRSKSAFFALASHDLRQPLYSLQLLSDHLRRQLTSAYQIEVADKMSGALTSMRKLFERMFDVARLEAQKVSFVPQPVSVHELFESLDHEFSLPCQEKGLRWSVHPSNDWIETDPVLAQRMLRNLLENAVRYTRQGEIRLRARSRAGQVHCQVWDTGLGIAKEDRHKVFDDYFQVHNTARQAQDGLGLGLGVVRRLVALTGAHLSLRSRPGKGSCFDIALPRVAAPRPVSSPAPLPAQAGCLDPLDAGPAAAWSPHDCVLVIEDQADVLDAVIAVLQDSGCQAIGGENAVAVVQEAARRDAWPRAVICDHRLGAAYSGFDAIAVLRHEFGHELPAILVTGDLDAGIAEQARQQGIRVMHKPIDRAQLLAAVHEEMALPPTRQS